MSQTAETLQNKPPLFNRLLRGTMNVSFSLVPIISGITLLTMSSAALPVALGIAAIGLGIYHSAITVQEWRKPHVPRPANLSAAAKVKEWLNNPNRRKAFKLKALIGAAMGAVKLATGMSIAANLGAVSSTLASGAAAVLSVFGAVATAGCLAAFGIFSVLTHPKVLAKVNTLLDKSASKKSQPEAKPAAPAAAASGPASKLDNADAKTGFNTAADPKAKPATNDNIPAPQLKPDTKKPAA